MINVKKVKNVKTVVRKQVVLIIGILIGSIFAKASAQTLVRQVKMTDPAIIAASTPAPLYRDPVFDGAADPALIWNRGRFTTSSAAYGTATP